VEREDLGVPTWVVVSAIVGAVLVILLAFVAAITMAVKGFSVTGVFAGRSLAVVRWTLVALIVGAAAVASIYLLIYFLNLILNALRVIQVTFIREPNPIMPGLLLTIGGIVAVSTHELVGSRSAKIAFDVIVGMLAFVSSTLWDNSIDRPWRKVAASVIVVVIAVIPLALYFSGTTQQRKDFGWSHHDGDWLRLVLAYLSIAAAIGIGIWYDRRQRSRVNDPGPALVPRPRIRFLR
jgi:hypothetical protein